MTAQRFLRRLVGKPAPPQPVPEKVGRELSRLRELVDTDLWFGWNVSLRHARRFRPDLVCRPPAGR